MSNLKVRLGLPEDRCCGNVPLPSVEFTIGIYFSANFSILYVQLPSQEISFGTDNKRVPHDLSNSLAVFFYKQDFIDTF